MFGSLYDRAKSAANSAADTLSEAALAAYQAPLKALNFTDEALATLAAKTNVKALAHLSTILKGARKGEIEAKAATLLGMEVVTGKAQAEVIMALCDAGMLEEFLEMFSKDDTPKLPPPDDTPPQT